MREIFMDLQPEALLPGAPDYNHEEYRSEKRSTGRGAVAATL